MNIPFPLSPAVVRALFTRGIAFVYAVAFVSLWRQVHGLIGTDGILPVGRYLESAAGQLGRSDAVLRLPTLLWFDAGNMALHLLCAGGTLAALLALTVGIWLVFDENVAKPIEKLAAELRMRAHAGVTRDVDTHGARFLGDLAHAAQAVSTRATDGAMETAQMVARETERLVADTLKLLPDGPKVRRLVLAALGA